MQRFNRLLATMMAMMLLVICLPAFAGMEGAEIPHGQEDLTKLTFEELQALFADISKAKNTYHTPSDAQKNGVLSATRYYSQFGGFHSFPNFS